MIPDHSDIHSRDRETLTRRAMLGGLLLLPAGCAAPNLEKPSAGFTGDGLAIRADDLKFKSGHNDIH